ncbi:MAG: HDOD domain-containing protein [Sterolibacterium sp.]|jgi:EAL and modified HD-GYP domain-containing signal transduction protein|nr:HDOD domain-containing protein [Sterolibacterium sp.]
MLDFFRRLLGKPTQENRATPTPAATSSAAPISSAAASASSDSFALLNKLAPLREVGGAPQTSSATTNSVAAATSSAATSATTAPPPSSFVCREPLLNRKEQIAGYSFSLHDKLQLRLQGEKDLLHKVYDDALLRNLTSLGVNSLLGHRLAFIRLSPASLDNPLIEKLPSANTVLMLTPGRQPLAPATLQTRLDAFRQQGFLYGWLLRRQQMEEQPHLLDLAAQADFIQCQTHDFDGLEIKSLLKTLTAKRPAGLNRAMLIAHELNTFDEFNLCFQGGFDLFLGDFIISRENWHPPKSDINRLLVIKLLNLLRGDEDIKVVAQQVTADPVMTFKLLRFLNSPAMGLQSPVATIDKAVLILGRERFYRWLSLLLFDIKAPGFRERMLTEQALTRAFFLESLAGEGQIPNKKDELFILGLFSMLDLLIGQPLESILQQTHLPPQVHAALIGEAGIYHIALQLACTLEDQIEEAIEQTATACGIDAVDVSRHSIEALSRAHEVMTISES